MTDKIISFTEFDPSRVVYKTPKDNGFGGTTIPVAYDCPRRGEIPLLLKTPKIRSPFGASQYPMARDNPAENIVKFSADMSFEGASHYPADHENATKSRFSNPEIGVMYEKFVDLEKTQKLYLSKNGKKLLNKKYSLEVLEELCNPVVKYSKDKVSKDLDGKYAPKITVKLRRDKKEKGSDVLLNTFNSVKVYTTKDKKNAVNIVAFKSKTKGDDVVDTTVPISTVIPFSSDVRGLIYCYGLTVVSGKISMPWFAKQLMVYPGQDEIKENVFADDSDDDDDSGPSVTENAFEDSDDDEPVPVVAKKPTKKVTKNAAPVKTVIEDSDSEEEVEVEEDSDDEEEVEVEEDSDDEE